MPKLFPISLEVEEVAVGRVLRILNSMAGIVRLHLNLTPDGSDKPVKELSHDEGEAPAPSMIPKAKWRTDGRMNSKGVSVSKNIAYRTIAEVLIRTPAHYKILQAALLRIGSVHPQAIHGHLHRMNTLKLVKRTAPGTYRLTEKGEKIFNPGEDTEKQERKLLSPGRGGYKVIDNHVGVRHLILKTLNKSGPMPGSVLTKVLKGAGYSPKNLSTTGMKMRNEGLFEVKDGSYHLTNAGRNVLDSPPDHQGSDPQTSKQQELTDNG